MALNEILQQKITDHSARIGVVGLGYVGLPLATSFGQNGHAVMGVDIDRRKIDQLTRGLSYIQDVPSEVVASLIAAERFTASADELHSGRAIRSGRVAHRRRAFYRKC